MTTDLREKYAPDAFAANDAVRLARAPEFHGQALAAKAWIARGGVRRDVQRRALSAAASLIRASFGDGSLWLLAGHSAWQPSSRVTRHRKLWGSLTASGLVIPSGRDVGGGVREGPDGLRYFGAIQLHPDAVEPAMAILEAERASCIAALNPKNQSVITELAASGWQTADNGPAPDLIGRLCEVGGIVLWLVGSFDDPEAGVVAVARPEVLDKVMS